MKRADAAMLINIRDAVARTYDRDAMAEMICNARELYNSCPTDLRDGEKADELLGEISRLNDVVDACEQLADAFRALRLDERSIA